MAATVIGILGKFPEADDVGQETFIRFCNALGDFRGDSSVEIYLTRIAINLSLNELKRRKRRRLLFLPLPGRKEENFAARTPQIEFNEEAERLHQAIQKLSPEFRSAVAPVAKWEAARPVVLEDQEGRVEAGRKCPSL